MIKICILIFKLLTFAIFHIALLSSCSNSNDSIDVGKVTSTEGNSILIDGSLIPDSLDISNIVESIKVIKIKETNEGIIGGVDKVFLTNGNYAIFDSFFSTKVVIYNSDGEFLKNLIKMGSGPEEMTKLSDVWMNDKGGLEVYDNSLNKVLVFDSTFNISKTFFKRNSSHFNSLIKLPSTSQYVAFSGYNGTYRNNSFYKLAILDSVLNVENLFFPYSRDLNQAFVATPINPFFIINDTVGFTQDYDPTVYNITSDGRLIKKYELVYDFKPLPTNLDSEIVLKNLSTFKYNGDQIDINAINNLFYGYTGFRGPWLETSKYAVFTSFDTGYSPFTSIYHKEQGKVIYQAKNFLESENFHMQIPPYFFVANVEGNRFVSVYEGHYALMLLKKSSPFYNMVKDDTKSFYIIDVKLK